MSQGETISSLGEIMQLAFVPSDFDAAVKYWTRDGRWSFLSH